MPSAEARTDNPDDIPLLKMIFSYLRHSSLRKRNGTGLTYIMLSIVPSVIFLETIRGIFYVLPTTNADTFNAVTYRIRALSRKL